MVMMMGAGLPLGGIDSAGEQYSGCRPASKGTSVFQLCLLVAGDCCGQYLRRAPQEESSKMCVSKSYNKIICLFMKAVGLADEEKI
jgi:hypothetical protein